MKLFDLGIPTGVCECTLCKTEIRYHTYGDMLKSGISGGGGHPKECKSCRDIKYTLVKELGDKIQRDCDDCGCMSYSDEYDGPIQPPGRLKSGLKCPSCKGTGKVGKVTPAQFKKLLMKKIKEKK